MENFCTHAHERTKMPPVCYALTLETNTASLFMLLFYYIAFLWFLPVSIHSHAVDKNSSYKIPTDTGGIIKLTFWLLLQNTYPSILGTFWERKEGEERGGGNLAIVHVHSIYIIPIYPGVFMTSQRCADKLFLFFWLLWYDDWMWRQVSGEEDPCSITNVAYNINYHICSKKIVEHSMIPSNNWLLCLGSSCLHSPIVEGEEYYTRPQLVDTFVWPSSWDYNLWYSHLWIPMDDVKSVGIPVL